MRASHKVPRGCRRRRARWRPSVGHRRRPWWRRRRRGVVASRRGCRRSRRVRRRPIHRSWSGHATRRAGRRRTVRSRRCGRSIARREAPAWCRLWHRRRVAGRWGVAGGRGVPCRRRGVRGRRTNAWSSVADRSCAWWRSVGDGCSSRSRCEQGAAVRRCVHHLASHNLPDWFTHDDDALPWAPEGPCDCAALRCEQSAVVVKRGCVRLVSDGRANVAVPHRPVRGSVLGPLSLKGRTHTIENPTSEAKVSPGGRNAADSGG